MTTRNKCVHCGKLTKGDHIFCDAILRAKREDAWTRNDKLLDDNPWLASVIVKFQEWEETHDISES